MADNTHEEMHKLIIRARRDLYYGPTYYDDDDEVCSFLDEGAKAFDFVGACTRIRDYIDEYALHDEKQVLVGKELSSYV